MNHFLIITVFLTISQAYAKPSPGEDEIDYKIRETLGQFPSEGSDWSWLTNDLKPVVVEKLLHQFAVKEGIERDNVESKLVRIGHAETIQRLVENLNDPRSKSRSLSEAGPDAIPYIMPLVYHSLTTAPPAPPMVPGHFEPTIYVPTRHKAISILLEIIGLREGFPPATRAWAGKMHNKINFKDEKWVALLTSWWEHNQSAILEKRYSAATWLPRYKGKPIAVDERQAEDYELQLETHRRERHSVTNITGATNDSSLKNLSSLAFWFAVISGSLAFFVILRKKLLKKNTL